MFTDLGLLFLRVTAGGMMFMFHGWGKIAAYSVKSATFPDPLGVGNGLSMALTIMSEGLGAVCVIVGLLTRVSSGLLVFTMLVAAFVVHAKDPFSRMEPALLYAIPFMALAIMGPGDMSLDRIIKSRRKKSIFG